MAAKARRVDYFHVTVKDRPGEAYRLLASLAAAKVNLLAFNAVPSGLEQTQLVLFPEDSHALALAAEHVGLVLSDPQRALLVQGDDELGALSRIHMKLYDARINVYSSNGIADGRGGYGYLVYVRSEDYDRAAEALEAP